MTDLSEKIEARGFGNRAFVPKGKLIIEAGSPAENLVFLLEGSALAFTNNSNGTITVYDKLRTGSIFGFEILSSLEDPFENHYIYSLRPITPCQILRCSVFGTSDIMARPKLSKEVHEAYNEFNRLLQKKLIDTQTKTAEERLATILLDFADRDRDGRLVFDGLSQTELGGAIFSTRESANRWLGCFIEAGLVTNKIDKKYTILDEEGLRRVADNSPVSSNPISANLFLG